MGFKISAKYQKKKNELILKFNEKVVSTGGVIQILDDNNKSLESINIGSDKIKGGIYHSNSMVWDYSTNWIALDNYDIFKHLANHDNIEIGQKTEEDWAFDLRTVWNVSIGGTFFRLDENASRGTSTDDYYNYHSTIPEYTPGMDQSGIQDIVLTPLGGIGTLKINLDKKNIKPGKSYKVDISKAGLKVANDNLNESEELNNIEVFKVTDKSPNKNDKNNKNNDKPITSNLFSSVDYFLSGIKQRKLANWDPDDFLTGSYKVKYMGKKKTKHLTTFTFNHDKLPAFMRYLGGNSLVILTQKENTPFGSADAEEGGKFNYYNGDTKVATLTLLRSDISKQAEQFKNTSYSGKFSLSLADSEIDFFQKGKNNATPWMSATFIDTLI